MIPVTQSDVEDALERELTDDEAETVTFKAKKAARLVEGYLSVEYVDGDVIPGVVTEVTAGVVARAYAAASNQVPEFVNTTSEGMGPFTVSRTFNPAATSGSLWLTSADKIKLHMVYSGVREVGMRSDRGYC
jgi:hypothetical protein